MNFPSESIRDVTDGITGAQLTKSVVPNVNDMGEIFGQCQPNTPSEKPNKKELFSSMVFLSVTVV